MKISLLLCLLFFTINSFALEKKPPLKVVTALRVEQGSINIDGRLDESIWKNESVNEFTQKDPNEGSPATQKTDVWIAYDNDNIYIAARMLDSRPELIDASLGRRDQYVNSDWFGFYVDPYNDKKTGDIVG